MCGIFFSFCRTHFDAPGGSLCRDLEKRGPDHCNTTRRKIGVSTEHSAKYLTFFSTVLSLRGDRIVEQPLIDPASSSVLCWNGEAWENGGTAVVGNDSEVVFDLLLEATISNDVDPPTRESVNKSAYDRLTDVISRVTGPFAFVYYDAQNAQIFYGRDALGRRSLLTNKDGGNSFAMSSICSPDATREWAEVEAGGIYRLDLHAKEGVFQPAALTPERNKYSSLALPQPLATSNLFGPHLLIHKAPRLPPFNIATPPAQLPILTLSSSVVDDLAEYLEASLRLRVKDIPVPPCEQLDPPRLAILFSGGLDCTLLARMVHDIVPKHQKIDLLNVAFENPRVTEAAAKRSESHGSQSVYASCPDRITGSSSHKELMKECPEREWRFVNINVPYTETIEHRPQIISLIQPHNTEMDLSIACALYFAARGRGLVNDIADNIPQVYTTPARVLLSGLGADEIFGGYQRHTTAFHRGGYSALIQELELDFSRLGKRNLGRDDRVISHWGKEVRYPYLDESLVAWALALPVWEKCGFGARLDSEKVPGNGLDLGKKLLRLLALKKGLYGAAFEKKRAIQFGARTAKMECGKVKGTQPLA